MKQRALLLTVLLVGAVAPAGAQRTRTQIDSTFAFDARGAVVLSANNGEIVVNGWDRPQIRVVARSDNEIRFDATGSRVSLDLARFRSGNTRFEVTVPRGVRVSARSTSGDVYIRGTRGIVDANTQSGDLYVEDAAEIVDLQTMSGDLDARDLTGDVEINTLNGDLTLANVRGDVEVTSVSGDIDLRAVTAKYVRARSTSGDILFDGAVDNAGRYELTSHSGSVTLLVPRATGALLTVATYSGGIESDFPIVLKPGAHMGSTKRFTFEVGKGDARITAESFSGDVTIRARGNTDR